MKAILSANHLTIIDEIAKSNGFENYELRSESGAKGENYFGTVLRVIIQDNRKRTLSLIVKIAPPKGPFRTNVPVRLIYLKEIHIYEKILESFRKFQDELGTSGVYTGFAKLLASSDTEFHEALVMEDLVESGYKMWNRKLQMDANHVMAVMRELARFHAVSYAAKKDPKLYGDISNSKFLPRGSLTVNNKENVEFYLSIILPAFNAAVNGDEKIRISIDKLWKGAEKLFVQEMREEDIEEMVVNHGDDWNNNIFFKYEDIRHPEKPTGVCFIDWQLARFGSPVLDISYFFFTSASKEILYDYEKYLKIYHESLSESLRALSCEQGELFPYSALERHWKKYCRFGLFLAPLIFKLMIVDTENAPDLVKNVKDIKDFYKEMASVSREEDRRVIGEKIRILLEFMIEHDLL